MDCIIKKIEVYLLASSTPTIGICMKNNKSSKKGGNA